MNTRTAIAAFAAATLAACASTPMNRDALRRHGERNCRVQAVVSPAYAIGSAGTGIRSVAYARCLRSAGFEAET
ncbi:hypothetical protein IHE49_17420 [Rhodanobacter sp. 7MK24]|uniref:hypothetical protein n=1 Tax=Rhodanobacter sp. 7MK24 TaxID=2775922 RepID=UPI00177C309F|nr:hypothetical protein [Rhodanobacter sp. 7MK24]MBD8882265.1 hypothetical protein [Rhodanobacter sp. 7MK24]